MARRVRVRLVPEVQRYRCVEGRESSRRAAIPSEAQVTTGGTFTPGLPDVEGCFDWVASTSDTGSVYVWLRVPGKWCRLVRLFLRTVRGDGGWQGASFPGHLGCQVVDMDLCPLDRGPIVWLDDLKGLRSDWGDSPLAGIEWCPYTYGHREFA